MTLTLLGLGPGNPGHRTAEANRSLESATRILLRTSIHPGLEDLVCDPKVSTCDDLYQSGWSFRDVYEAIIERVLAQAADGDLVFAVPGHPLIGESTTRAILSRAAELGIQTRVVTGVSALDVLATALHLDLMADEVQILDATELQEWIEQEPFTGSLPDFSPLRPVLLTQVYSQPVASAVKLALARIYPNHHRLVVARAGGVPGAEVLEQRALFELDRGSVDHLTSVWVPPLAELEATRHPLTLHRIAARLRAPGGCPWDRKQTHASLHDSAIEEAYEVADAIDAGEPDHLAEELGDLALQVAMHAQIAEEEGMFSIGDVFDHVNRKLIRRHPHVFGTSDAETPDAVVKTWNQIKAQERAERGEPQSDRVMSPYDRLPRSMPVARRVAKCTTIVAGSDATGEQVAKMGDELLRIVQTLARAGNDPEYELEHAYRRQFEQEMAQPMSSPATQR